MKPIKQQPGKHYTETVKRHSQRKGFGSTLSHTMDIIRNSPEKMGVTDRQIKELKRRTKEREDRKKIKYWEAQGQMIIL